MCIPPYQPLGSLVSKAATSASGGHSFDGCRGALGKLRPRRFSSKLAEWERKGERKKTLNLKLGPSLLLKDLLQLPPSLDLCGSAKKIDEYKIRYHFQSRWQKIWHEGQANSMFDMMPCTPDYDYAMSSRWIKGSDHWVPNNCNWHKCGTHEFGECHAFE